MTLADELRNAPEKPEQLGSFEFDKSTGVGELKDVPSSRPLELAEDWAPIFERFGFNPANFEIVDDTVRCSTWQQSKRTESGDRDTVQLYSYRAMFRRKREAIDLPALMAAVRATRPRKAKPRTRVGRLTHVVYSDPQWGKSGSRGGLVELLDRMEEKRGKLDAYMRRNPSDKAYLWDPGDGVENIHSVAAQLATNNLSLPDQVDAYATDLWEFLRVMAKHGPIESVIVPSNHSQWRRAKELLALPTDDWGIHVHKRIQQRAETGKLPLTSHFPDAWDEAMSVDVGALKIGLIHGHQARSLDRMVDLWKSHTHGNGALHDVDVLISGHWHVPKLTFTGRSPRTGKSKIHIGAPTLDNGSDWWRNIDGSDADPGLFVFQTDEDGFDLSSFAIL